MKYLKHNKNITILKQLMVVQKFPFLGTVEIKKIAKIALGEKIGD